jgi:hypothetical protein
MHRLIIGSIQTRYHLCILLAAVSSFVFSTAASQPLDTMWQRTLGGASEDYVSFFLGVDSTGCLIGGDMLNHLNWEDEDFLIYRASGDGEPLWNIHYGEREYREHVRHAWTMPDGGFLLYCSWAVLEFNSGGEFLMRVSAEGDTLWTRPLEFELPDSASVETVQLTHDGKLLLGGCSRNTHWGNCDMFYALADTSGDTLWTKQYTDGETDDDMVATVAMETADGYAFSTNVAIGYGRGFVLLLTDSLGEVQRFQQCMHDTTENYLNGMTTTHDGGFLLCGYRQCGYETDNINGILLKMDSEGDSLWLAVVGVVEWWEEFVNAIETQDGGVLAVGRKEWDHDGTWTGFDVWVVKLDSAGTVEWEATYGSVRQEDNAIGVYQLPDGGFLIGGQTDVSIARPDFLVIRTWPEGWNATDETELHPVEFKLMQNFPNPFNGETKIEFSLGSTAPVTLTVFDLLGREVKQLARGTLAEGRYSYYFYGNDLPSGVYLYRLQAGSSVATKKMVLLR